MPPTPAALGSLTFALSGLLFIVFWAMAPALQAFYGAAAALHPVWGPSQLVHCFAAVAGLLGTAGVHGKHASKTAWCGLLGSACALVGQASFFADGVIAYAVFPPIAKAIPSAVDLDGFMFTGANYSAYTAFCVIFMVGYITLGASLLYYRALPAAPAAPHAAEACAVALIIGSILANLPPTAGFGVICAGGIIWGAGAGVLGALWALAEAREQPESGASP